MDSRWKKDNLSSLHLSVRSQNALGAYGVHTVDDLLNLPKFELLKIPNLGSISILEISRALEDFLSENNLIFDDHISFMDKNGLIHSDIKLEDSGLSSRCCHRLKSADIFTVKALMDTSLFDLKSIPYLGKSCIDEIEKLENSLEVLILHREKGEAWTPAHVCNELIYSMNDILGQTSYDFYQDLLKLCRNFFDNQPQKSYPKDLTQNKAFLSRLYRLDSFCDVLDHHLLRSLKQHKDGLSFDDLVRFMPDFAHIEDLVEDRLELLENHKFLNSMGQLYFPVYPSILQVLRDRFPSREASVYQLRMNGTTLQEIGDKFDLSRERVRQILLAMNSSLNADQIYTSEDYYRPYIQKYDLDRELFEKIFEEKLAYGYIETRYGIKAQGLPMGDLLKEKGISNLARNNLKGLLSQKILFLKDGYIEKNRQEIIHYLLKKYGQDQIPFDDYYVLYQDFIENFQLSKDPSINLSKHNLMNKLSNDNFVLWSFGRTLRYYPFDHYDCKRLLKNLNLDQYRDVEFSSRYFFTRHPKTMAAYDIRDEYELHNLLRKICLPEDYPQIKFLRMPNIQIGDGNREDQMLDLLKANSPIDLHSLASLYEKKYGVHHTSVISSYLKCIEDYHYKGSYDINRKVMPLNLAQEFRSRLDRDFYFNDDLIALFKKFYPNEDPSLINSRSCRQMKFKVYQAYCISEKFQFAQDFFHSILLAEPMYPVDKFSKRFWALSNVLTCFYSLKRDLCLFNYDKKTLITYKYLQDKGIHRQDLVDFRQSILDFVEPGSHFTLSYLRALGHDHKLYSLGLPSSFFESLIAEDTAHFTSESSSGEMLFYYGKKEVDLESFLDQVSHEIEEGEDQNLPQVLGHYSLEADS